jgi:hypothetical protein
MSIVINIKIISGRLDSNSKVIVFVPRLKKQCSCMNKPFWLWVHMANGIETIILIKLRHSGDIHRNKMSGQLKHMGESNFL